MVLHIKNIGLVVWLLLFFLPVYPQGPEGSVQAIHDRLEQETDVGTRIGLYMQLVDFYMSRNADSANYYIDAGLDLSEQVGDISGQAEMHAFRGDFLVTQDRLSEARASYELAADLFTETNELSALAGVYLVLGNIHWVQDNHVLAFEYYTFGEILADSLSIGALLPDFHNNLGTAYLMMEEYDQALKYYTSAIELFKQSGNLEPVPVSMINLATIYVNLGRMDDARNMCREVFQITDTMPGSKLPIILAYQEMGNIDYAQSNFEAALSNYSYAMLLINDLPADFMGPRSVNKALLFLKKGLCYFNLEQSEIAREHLESAYNLGNTTGQLGIVKDASLKLSQLYEQKGNTQKGLEYLKTYTRYSDSISNETTAKRITQIKMKYEFDKKLREKEMERLAQEEAQKRKELILYLIAGSILAALIVVFLLLRLQKNKNRRIELEQSNLKLDLEYKNKELTTNVMYLLQKNEFILKISERLTKMRHRFKEENREVIDAVVREIESSSKEVNWKDFELRFQEVHSGFYKEINELYPDLTPNEMKLCAFLRLNMTTKEISSITYQSYNSIIMARHRLRKKLKIDTAENLVSYLQSL